MTYSICAGILTISYAIYPQKDLARQNEQNRQMENLLSGAPVTYIS